MSRLWAMFAIQGPRSVELLQPLVDVDLQSMRYYRGAQVRILHPAAQRQGGIISRTGYTGEDGFELSLGAGIAARRVGSADGAGQAAGRRAHRARRPRHAAARGRHAALRPRAVASRSIRSRPAWASPATWSATIFPAATPCCGSQKQPLDVVRIGLEMAGKRVPRARLPDPRRRPAGRRSHQRHAIRPRLQKPIAMGYVPPKYAAAAPSLPSMSAVAASRPAW